MKTTVVFILLNLIAFSQVPERRIATERKNTVSVYGGMGIQMVGASGIVEYINAVTTVAQRVDDFGTAVDFFGGADVPVGEDWGIAVEHSYVFKSYTVPGNLGGTYDLYYSIHAPSLLVQKVFKGKGTFLKFSAGGGYHFGRFIQKVSTFGVESEYTSAGIGLRANAVAQTAFGDDLYGYIGGTAGWGSLGTLTEKDGKSLVLPRTGSEVTFRYLHAGIRFGIVQYF